MLTFFLSPLPFILAFILYIASDIIRRRQWAKYCLYTAVVLFVVTFSVWINSFAEKVIDGRIGLHRQLVTSVTYHVEKLLKNGDYEKAEMILSSFNSKYQYYSENNEKPKDFIKSLDVPLFAKEIEELEMLKSKIDDKRSNID